jgi:hypothetical protein
VGPQDGPHVKEPIAQARDLTIEVIDHVGHRAAPSLEAAGGAREEGDQRAR